MLVPSDNHRLAGARVVEKRSERAKKGPDLGAELLFS